MSAIRDAVTTGPAPLWAATNSFRAESSPPLGAAVSHLLLDHQFHAELNQTFIHRAIRLETMAGVQGESPWTVQLTSARERIVLHWIKTHRGTTHFDHINLSQARLRDASAPQPVVTLMLDDVRPGDILEWCYTIEHVPSLVIGRTGAWFELPAASPVEAFYFSVRFAARRPMRWKSSEPAWSPTQTNEGTEALWVWVQEAIPGRSPELHAPPGWIAQPWIQVSDCGSWNEISAAFQESWADAPVDDRIREVVLQIQPSNDGQVPTAAQAIRWVQEQFRCMASSGPLDATPPIAPAITARRRYGTNKDLAFLLTQVLRALGLPARLILSSTVFRRTLPDLLPSPDLFDHALVEYTSGDETLWVDAAPFAASSATYYHFGLPLVQGGAELVAAPVSTRLENAIERTEHFLLDTTDAWSMLSIVTAARGALAEQLRRAWNTEGAEAFARRCLREHASRFGEARRVKEMAVRDDPVANEFFLAEVLEVKGFLPFDPALKMLKLEFANTFLSDFLIDPGELRRATPLAVPHPLYVSHTIELNSGALRPMVAAQKSIKTPALNFVRYRRTLAGNWTFKLSLNTLGDAIAPEAVPAYRKTLAEVQKLSKWSMLLPTGEDRPQKRGDFGALPKGWNPVPPISAPVPPPVAPPRPAPAPAQPVATVGPIVTQPAPVEAIATASATKPKRHKRIRRKDEGKPGLFKPVLYACILGLVLIGIVVAVVKNADRLGLSKLQAPTPPLPSQLLLQPNSSP